MAYLIAIGGLPAHQTIPLTHFPTTLGRGGDTDVPIDVRGVSRQHAMLERDEEGEVVLTDLASRNGTFVNGARVASKVLAQGDLIRIGKAEFRYESGEAETTPVPHTRSTGVIGLVPRREQENPFDTQALARRLVGWAEEWGPCAVEFRFRHGSQSHSCWVATDVGRTVLGEFFMRLEREASVLQVNPSVTEVLFALAGEGRLQEDQAWGWINGEATGYPGAPPLDAGMSWDGVSEQPGWWSATAKPWTGPGAVPALEDARRFHAQSLGPGRSYLYVAIPERAIRTSGVLGDIVVLHALWAQEGTHVYESVAPDTSKVEFQRRVRDAATQFLIWTSVRLLNREARARALWQRAAEAADALFNGAGTHRIAPHDPARWSESDLATHASRLLAICADLRGALGELGGELSWPEDESVAADPSACWQLLVAKAVSHKALHPLVILGLLETWDAPATEAARAMPCAIVVRTAGGDEHTSDLALAMAFIELRRAEGPNLSGVGMWVEGHHLRFAADVDVHRSREDLAAAILFREPASEGHRGKTTQAFASLRRFADAVAVETSSTSAGRALAVTLRFGFESYEAPSGS